MQTSLEKSEEILPEAEAAVYRINNDSGVLKDTNLELVTASSSSIIENDEPCILRNCP